MYNARYFKNRVQVRTHGGLTVHIAGRLDQIHFKLYAAVDQGPESKHFADLKQLGPTSEELVASARWARSHDPSPAFRENLKGALEYLGVEDAEI